MSNRSGTVDPRSHASNHRSSTASARPPRPSAPPTRANATARPQTSRRDGISLSAETRHRERSNGQAAIAGLANAHGSNGQQARGRQNSEARQPGQSNGPRSANRVTDANRRNGQPGQPAAGPNPRGNGWHAETEPSLSDRHIEALQRVAPGYSQAHHGRELVVVSGERDGHRSADTLLRISPEERQHLYGRVDGHEDYENAIRAAQEQERRERPWYRFGFEDRQRTTQLLEERINQLTHRRNPEYLSGHQRGDSFDVSVTRGNMSVDDIRDATRRFQEAGYHVLFEGDHLHVDMPVPGHDRITSAEPTITEAEARTVNTNQRRQEIEAGAPRRWYEYLPGFLGGGPDPGLAGRRIEPTPQR